MSHSNLHMKLNGKDNSPSIKMLHYFWYVKFSITLTYFDVLTNQIVLYKYSAIQITHDPERPQTPALLNQVKKQTVSYVIDWQLY